jgi:hypothetical protein
MVTVGPPGALPPGGGIRGGRRANNGRIIEIAPIVDQSYNFLLPPPY